MIPEKWKRVFRKDHASLKRLSAGNQARLASSAAFWLLATQEIEDSMVPFFVQIKCKLGEAYDVANRIADSEIASEIYSTAGDYDLLVKFYVSEGTDIG